MDPTDLDFRGQGAPAATDEVVLDFAAASTAPPEPVSCTVRCALGAPAGRAVATYDAQVDRKCALLGRVGWSSSNPDATGAAALWRQSMPQRTLEKPAWAGAARRSASTSVAVDSCAPRYAEAGSGWHAGTAVAAAVREPYRALARLGLQRSQPWGQLAAASLQTAAGFAQLLPRPGLHLGAWRSAAGARRQLTASFLAARPAGARWREPWHAAGAPGLGVSRLPPPPPPPPPAPAPAPDLNFATAASQASLAWLPLLTLDFAGQARGPGRVVPALRVYFVSNSVSFVRLPDRMPIPVTALAIDIDADSWAWGLSATLPYSALELIQPDADGPVQAEVTVNGVTWVMLLESYDLQREFARASITVRGRSAAAFLAAPYAPQRSTSFSAPINASQIVQQELSRPGLDTGFALHWQLVDWLVPANAWSYEALTPMEVIGQVAAAAGGYVNADPALPQLAVKPRYPSLPWEWAGQAADITLPIDVVQTLSLQWAQKPTYNAVMVAGERQGFTARVYRSGTAGDLMAPMVVDGLVCQPEAARARGGSVLADVGYQATVSLGVPMLADLGLLQPGQLVEVADSGSSWRGLVRGTHIAASWERALTVRQSVDVGRHYL